MKDEKKPESAISNGAFYLEEYQAGSHLLLKRILTTMQQTSKLPGIKAVFITDDNTAYQAYQAGEIDVMITFQNRFHRLLLKIHM